MIRATDIAKNLNEDKTSPYYSCIKLPGTSKGGKIDVSTMVASIKQMSVYGLLHSLTSDRELFAKAVIGYDNRSLTILGRVPTAEMVRFLRQFFVNRGSFDAACRRQARKS